MKILVIGSGGREHALAWRLARDGHDIVAAPGNPGIAEVARCVAVAAGAIAALVELAVAERVDLVVVGPEAPLVAGLADQLRAHGIATFGPGADGARLEGSKAFSKQFFARHGIRTAAFAICTTVAEADAAIGALGPAGGDGRVVVKADGLAAGKGVVVARDAERARAAARAMLAGRAFGAAGATILIEQCITGREVSVLAICDGERLCVLPPIEDHKAIGDGDHGPNTGGMGTVSPAWTSPEHLARITAELLAPTVAGLRADGVEYRGVLYAGVMIDGDGAPWLIEYNCRFGDPETQPVMMRLGPGLAELLAGAAAGALPAAAPAIDPRTAVCVVVAAAGYPDAPRTGDAIGALPPAAEDLMIFHAGTARDVDGVLRSAGGRVLGVTALGVGVDAARARAYAAVDAIALPGKQVRRDIGARGRPSR